MEHTEIAAIASLVLNAIALTGWLKARTAAAAYRASEQYMMRAYDRLRANSHRRDPRTGRLMPKGK